MSLENKEPFTVRVNVAGYLPKAWVVWTNFSSDALIDVLTGLDVAEPIMRIRSAPSTPDECIQNRVFQDGETLEYITHSGGQTEI